MRMLASPLRRWLAGVVALVAATSSPALAFAHGHAHAELREHAAEPHHALVTGASIGAADDDHAHAHAAVDARVCTRVSSLAVALPAATVAPEYAAVVVHVEQPPRAVTESPPQYGAHPPPASRAPPVSAL